MVGSKVKRNGEIPRAARQRKCPPFVCPPGQIAGRFARPQRFREPPAWFRGQPPFTFPFRLFFLLVRESLAPFPFVDCGENILYLSHLSQGWQTQASPYFVKAPCSTCHRLLLCLCHLVLFVFLDKFCGWLRDGWTSFLKALCYGKGAGPVQRLACELCGWR